MRRSPRIHKQVARGRRRDRGRGIFSALSHVIPALCLVFCASKLFTRNPVHVHVHCAFGPSDTANSPLGYGTVDHDGRVPSFADDKVEDTTEGEVTPEFQLKQNIASSTAKATVPLHASAGEKAQFGSELMNWQAILDDITDITPESSTKIKDSFAKYFERNRAMYRDGEADGGGVPEKDRAFVWTELDKFDFDVAFIGSSHADLLMDVMNIDIHAVHTEVTYRPEVGLSLSSDMRVSKIADMSAAQLSRLIKVGDRLISIDGTPINDLVIGSLETGGQALQYVNAKLKEFDSHQKHSQFYSRGKSSVNQYRFVLRFRPGDGKRRMFLPSDNIRAVLYRMPLDKNLGIVIDSKFLSVTEFVRGNAASLGPAERSGQVHLGDRVLAANGEILVGRRFDIVAEKLKLKAVADYTFQGGFRDDTEIQTITLLLRPADNRAGNRLSDLGFMLDIRKRPQMPLDFNVLFDTTEAIGLILQKPGAREVTHPVGRLFEGFEVVGFTKTHKTTIDDSPFGAIEVEVAVGDRDAEPGVDKDKKLLSRGLISPAEQAGLIRIGDRILKINDIPLGSYNNVNTSLTYEDAMSLLNERFVTQSIDCRGGRYCTIIPYQKNGRPTPRSLTVRPVDNILRFPVHAIQVDGGVVSSPGCHNFIQLFDSLMDAEISRNGRQAVQGNSSTSEKFENVSQVVLDRAKVNVMARLKRITTVSMPANGRVEPGAPLPIPLPPGVIVQKRDRKQKMRRKQQDVQENTASTQSPLEISIQNRVSSFTAPVDGTAAFQFYSALLNTTHSERINQANAPVETIENATFPYLAALFGANMPCHRLPVVVAEPLDACSKITNAPELRGSLTLVMRGGCFFADKATNVQEAGAAGLLVINSGPGLVRMPAGEQSRVEVHIPCAMVPYTAYEVAEKALKRGLLFGQFYINKKYDMADTCDIF